MAMRDRRGDFPCPNCGEHYRETALRCPSCGEANPLQEEESRGAAEPSGLRSIVFSLIAIALGGFLLIYGLIVEPLFLSRQVNTHAVGLGCLSILVGMLVRAWRQSRER
jgi:predicted RNA-binding Zn-ribbon protein involved in translation (DUF1610 family)